MDRRAPYLIGGTAPFGIRARSPATKSPRLAFLAHLHTNELMNHKLLLLVTDLNMNRHSHENTVLILGERVQIGIVVGRGVPGNGTSELGVVAIQTLGDDVEIDKAGRSIGPGCGELCASLVSFQG